MGKSSATKGSKRKRSLSRSSEIWWVRGQPFPLAVRALRTFIQVSEVKVMRTLRLTGCAVAACVLFTAGCRHNNTVDKDAFKTALNDYYRTRQVCLWDGSIKLPAQAD